MALQHAERLGELERDAARDAGDVLGRGQREQRPEQLLDMRLEPEIEPRLHGVARRAGQMLVGEDAHARAQHVVARGELADRLAEPADAAVGGEHELLVGRMRQLGGARIDLAGERLLRGGAQRLAFGSGGGGVGGELESPRAGRSGGPRRRPRRICVISVSSIVFSRSRRINTLVRRSTKRSARRSCSASDSLSSTPRVMPCQCSGSASQSGRFAAKVQVLMWAIRFASVSISPSVRSACATCAANQSGGIVPSRIRKP